MLDTPILFLIFNRPVFTQQVFAEIKKTQPKYLYIAADGPRDNKPGEQELCEETRRIVVENIDWPCHIKTLFRDTNMGCGRAPAEAITWFFNEVDRGIILEDDCLPEASFFKFCGELLAKYKDDEKVMAISGTNFFEEHETGSSYFFSVYGGNWGWASWKRAWLKFDYNITDWKIPDCKQGVSEFISNEGSFKYYSNEFDQLVKSPRNDVWDYQWFFSRVANHGLSIIPRLNQIRNIGFGKNATHTFESDNKIAKLKTGEIQFPLLTNGETKADKSYDSKFYSEFIKPGFDDKSEIKSKIKKALKIFK